MYFWRFWCHIRSFLVTGSLRIVIINGIWKVLFPYQTLDHYDLYLRKYRSQINIYIYLYFFFTGSFEKKQCFALDFGHVFIFKLVRLSCKSISHLLYHYEFPRTSFMIIFVILYDKSAIKVYMVELNVSFLFHLIAL